MDGWERRLTLTHPFDNVKPDLLDETLIRRLIDRLKLDPDALAVADAEPAEAYPGTAMIITGKNFSAARFDNIVEVVFDGPTRTRRPGHPR